MYKRLTISALLLILAVAGFAQGEAALYKTVKTDYQGKADSLTNCFIEKFMNKSKGIFNEKPKTYGKYIYWQQAHAIDVLIYAYERNKDTNPELAEKYKKYMELWFTNKANNYEGATPSITGSYKMFENPFTDDMCWITLALLHMNEATGIAKYYTVAKGIFDNLIIKRANTDEETGGLWLPWKSEAGSGPNACTQSPATLIAAKLYQRTGTEKYLTYAKQLYTYTSKKITFSDGRVEEPPLTYTQGTFGEACRILYHITDEPALVKNKYKTLAFTYINYAFTSDRCTNGKNILRHEGTSMDQAIFKAVLIPYAVNHVLDVEMVSKNRQTIAEFIHKNAQTMYATLDWSRYPTVFCNYDWTQPYTGADNDASMGAMCSGASLLENTARMDKAIIENYNDYYYRTNLPKYSMSMACEETEPGKEYTVKLSMRNNTNITSWKASLSIPDGMMLKDVVASGTVYGENFPEVTVTTDDKGQNFLTCTPESPLAQKSTEIATITLQATDGIKEGEYELKLQDIVFTDVNNMTWTKADTVSATLNVTTPTGIRGIASATSPAASTVYDLQGRRLATPMQRGMYIRDRKKYVVK